MKGQEWEQAKLPEELLKVGLRYTTDLIQHVNLAENRQVWHGDVDGLLGYDPGEFPRTFSGWYELIHPDDVARVQAQADRVVAEGLDSWHFQYRIRCKDGTYRHWLDRGKVVGLLDGRPNEGVGGIIDQTDQVLARQELERALSEVQQLKDELQQEALYLRGEIQSIQDFGDIVGSSAGILKALRQVEMVAPTSATVLLQGETGTGKELLARAIHEGSTRADRPLIKVDCGTLPAGLIESELFGHEKGAFTGAHRSKPGRFELAHRGTIFLDEVGELPLELQSKLLRVLDDGELMRVGATAEKRVDVRVIAATNRDLRDETRENRFRPDLYYRLSVFPIDVPALRERREDIPVLASVFMEKFAARFGKSCRRMEPASMAALTAYTWPGNIRELRNVIERSVILCQGDTLTVEEWFRGTSEVPQPAPATGPLQEDMLFYERARVTRALAESNWKIKGEGNAASRLGVTPSGLRSRMKRLGITRPE